MSQQNNRDVRRSLDNLKAVLDFLLPAVELNLHGCKQKSGRTPPHGSSSIIVTNVEWRSISTSC